jgi:hypothetical protein
MIETRFLFVTIATTLHCHAYMISLIDTPIPHGSHETNDAVSF